MKLTAKEAQQLSAMLFRCQNHLEMWLDVVEIRTGKRDEGLAELIEEVKTFRGERDWEPLGFGDEQEVNDDEETEG